MKAENTKLYNPLIGCHKYIFYYQWTILTAVHYVIWRIPRDRVFSFIPLFCLNDADGIQLLFIGWFCCCSPLGDRIPKLARQISFKTILVFDTLFPHSTSVNPSKHQTQLLPSFDMHLEVVYLKFQYLFHTPKIQFSVTRMDTYIQRVNESPHIT